MCTGRVRTEYHYLIMVKEIALTLPMINVGEQRGELLDGSARFATERDGRHSCAVVVV